MRALNTAARLLPVLLVGAVVVPVALTVKWSLVRLLNLNSLVAQAVIAFGSFVIALFVVGLTLLVLIPVTTALCRSIANTIIGILDPIPPFLPRPAGLRELAEMCATLDERIRLNHKAKCRLIVDNAVRFGRANAAAYVREFENAWREPAQPTR